MENHKKNLLLHYLLPGFLLGVACIVPQIGYYINSTQLPFTDLILHKYTFSLLCLIPFVSSVTCYFFGSVRTRLEDANQQLKANESKMKIIVEELSEYKFALDQSAIITVIDENGKFKRVNDNFVAYTGYNSSEVIGRSVWRLPSSLQKEGVFQGIRQIVDAEKVWRGEIEYYKQGDAVCYTTAIVVPLSHIGKVNKDCLVIQYDISAEKNTALALRKSEKEKNLIIANNPSLILTHDLNGTITSINKAGAEILATSQEQLVGTSIVPLLHPAPIERYLSAIQKNRSAEGHLNYTHKSGKTATLLYRNIICSDKEQSYVICSAVDVTKTREAQKEVEEQRAFTRQILDESGDLVCVIDEKQQVRLVNNHFKKFFDFPGLKNNMPVSEMMLHCSGIGGLLHDESLRFDGVPDKCVFECRLKEDKTNCAKWFKVQKTIFTDKVGTRYIVLSATDFSERKEKELALIKAHTMVENSLKMKEQFIANMSHEIRTPLNAIIGFTDLLLDTSLGYTQRDYLHTVKTAGQNLLGIINDILDLSAIDSGNLRLSKRAVNVRQVVHNLERLMQPRVLEKQIYFKVNLSEDLPQVVYSDEARLNQLLTNLAGNAVKFTEKGGVAITVDPVIGPDQNKTYVRFEIKDSGIGIEKEKLAVIFDRYSQASPEIHNLYGGTGLGLSITKSFVELFGGEINVTSRTGSGTTFVVVLAFDREGKQVVEKTSAATPVPTFVAPTATKILLAEDNNTNAKLALQVLKKRGFNVHRVKDGIEVLQALKDDKYDLILMDVQMITQDGVETTRIIRAGDTPYANIPVIALTAQSFKGEQTACYQVGMNGYVSKPFTASELFTAIDTVLRAQEEFVAAEEDCTVLI